MSFLFGKEETKTEVPGFIKDAGEYVVDRGKEFNQRGFMPYMGPTVAALSPQQHAAMLNNANAAATFGLQAPGATAGYGGFALGNTPAVVGDDPKSKYLQSLYQKHFDRAPDQAGYDFWMGKSIDEIQNSFGQGAQRDPLTGLPMAGQFGGIAGYSAFPIYADNMQRLNQTYPGLMDYQRSFSVDPLSSVMPAGGFMPAGGNAGNVGILQLIAAQKDDRSAGERTQDQFAGGGGQDSAGGGGFNFGGYSGIGDMFDGGGPGTSGDNFQGGGFASAIGNAFGGPGFW